MNIQPSEISMADRMLVQQNRELARYIKDVATHYGRDLAKFSFVVWIKCLARYDMEVIRCAFGAYAMNPDMRGVMPTTNEILKEIEGTSVDTAELAWAKAHHAIARVGKHFDVVFDDPIIHAVIQVMGGWIKFCSVTDDELPFHRLHFIKTYQAYRRSHAPLDYPRLLVGMSTQQNAIHGFKCEVPHIIGDPDKARLVYQNASGSGGLRISRMPLSALTHQPISNANPNNTGLQKLHFTIDAKG